MPNTSDTLIGKLEKQRVPHIPYDSWSQAWNQAIEKAINIVNDCTDLPITSKANDTNSPVSIDSGSECIQSEIPVTEPGPLGLFTMGPTSKSPEETRKRVSRITNDWLKNRIDNDPDLPCEVGENIKEEDFSYAQAVNAAQTWASDQGDTFTLSQAQDLVDTISPHLTKRESSGEEECHYIIYFEDREVPQEHFGGYGAKEAALKRFKQISDSWNATLFKQYKSNINQIEGQS